MIRPWKKNFYQVIIFDFIMYSSTRIIRDLQCTEFMAMHRGMVVNYLN